jgi:hypothetical protein
MVETTGAPVLAPDSEGESEIARMHNSNDVSKHRRANAAIAPAPRQHDAREQQLVRVLASTALARVVATVVDHTL